MFRYRMALPGVEIREGYHIEHPNQHKASSKATKAVVILLLVVSAALMTIVMLGGWSKLAGMQVVLIGWILVYILMAYYVARWNRGVLPLAAALAILMGIFAAIAGPEWFDRDKAGFSSPALDESILGLVTLLIVPVQVLLIGFAMRGFQQAWNVEVEVPDGQHYEPGKGYQETGGRTATA
jgi:presenilin-like A22 family membrane protease